MSNTDIRAWAREKGLDVNARGPVNKAVVELYDAEHAGPDEPEYVFTPGLPDEPIATGESVPQIKPAGLKGKLTSLGKNRAPAQRGRRQSLERVGGLLWNGLANVVGGVGLVPASRLIAMQAPIAGMVVEDTLKGTVVDKVAQPVARFVGKGGDLSALVSPVIMVTAIQRNPKLYPTLKPYLEDALWSYVDVAGPYFKKLEERKEKRAAMVAEGFDMEALIQSLFAPIPGQEEPGDQPEDTAGP